MLVVEMALAFGLTFLISLLLIRFAPMFQVSIKAELESTHGMKRGTPSVGGLAFVMGSALSTLIFASRFDLGVLLPLVALVLFAAVGLVDDLAKARRTDGDGISSLSKLALQALAGSLLLFILQGNKALTTTVMAPFLKEGGLTLGGAYYLFALLYILYFVNAVNITDGLDALAAGSSMPLLLLLAFFSYRAGRSFSPALIGAILAFLLFNRKPARYFMGDCGSHALGGYIAVSALMLKAETVILVASGLFLMEFATSLIQIIAIRSTGRKVFSIAPLHHAFELKGVAERTIVGRFTLASWIFASLGLLLFLGTGW
ncbi:MAG: phospho-N-acetylmuramoyl-pentapeptide-transferase [Sphaerochaeta sp.]|nr:phospho-N-acetylmuramoyl-pentapeptide-transferase [Sphaerochaeta sp.]